MRAGVGRLVGLGLAKGLFALGAALTWLGSASPAYGSQPAETARPGDLCWAAVERAAKTIGAPLPLLRAIALVESGRGSGDAYAPWPWTVNLDGRSYYFDDRPTAEKFVRGALAGGKTSFDVGCLQINHHWHGQAFASLEAMFDPEANAQYAARFLTELREETGDWMTAAGYYHSRTPKFFERYRKRVVRVLSQLPDAPASAVAEITAAAPLARAGLGDDAEGRSVAAAQTAPAAAAPRRLNPLRPSAWRGMLRVARGALVGGEQEAAAHSAAQRVARAPREDGRGGAAAALWAAALDRPASGGVRLSMWETAERGGLLARGASAAGGPDDDNR